MYFPAPVEAPAYTTPSTGNTFWLNTTPTGFFEAELACTTNGGHLASYLNRQEQVGGGMGTSQALLCCLAPFIILSIEQQLDTLCQ